MIWLVIASITQTIIIALMLIMNYRNVKAIGVLKKAVYTNQEAIKTLQAESQRKHHSKMVTDIIGRRKNDGNA